MNALHLRRLAVAVSAAAVLPLALSSCSSSDSKDSAAGSAPDKAGSASSPATGASADGSMAPDAPFGPACSSVPENGAGSFDGMAQDPVATAASNNPDLATLVTAVKAAGLVDTLNSAENITVFAPTNEAFAKVPKADLEKLLANKEELTKVLTYHVVGQKIAPKQLSNGSFTTLEKGKLTTSGSDMTYTVNDSAKIVCGNVRTANATVYIVDSVLMPPQ